MAPATVPKRKPQILSAEMIHLVQNAIEKGLSINKACAMYCVPKTTFLDKIKGRSAIDCVLGGHQSVLNPEEEKRLVRHIDEAAARRFPLKVNDLCDLVQDIVLDDKRRTPFRDGRPGRAWREGFMKRHPTLRQRLRGSVLGRRADLSEERLRGWFAGLEKFLLDGGIGDVLEQPGRIFNADESSFLFHVVTGRYLCVRRGASRQAKLTKENERMTTMCTYAADGNIAPTMVVYKGKRRQNAIHNSVPSGVVVARTDSGCIQAITFLEYCRVFHEWLVERDIPLPVLLLVDGHGPHLNVEVNTFCVDHGIVLYCLYPNASNVMYPAEGIFRPLKVEWDKTVGRYKRQTRKAVNKEVFAKLFDAAMKGSMKTETIENSFRKCGIYPFDPDAVDYDKCFVDKTSAEGEGAALMEETARVSSPDLLFLESTINKYNPSFLGDFRATKELGGEWSGDIRTLGLYEFWLFMTKKHADAVAVGVKVPIDLPVDQVQVTSQEPSPASDESQWVQNNVIIEKFDPELAAAIPHSNVPILLARPSTSNSIVSPPSLPSTSKSVSRATKFKISPSFEKFLKLPTENVTKAKRPLKSERLLQQDFSKKLKPTSQAVDNEPKQQTKLEGTCAYCEKHWFVEDSAGTRGLWLPGDTSPICGCLFT